MFFICFCSCHGLFPHGSVHLNFLLLLFSRSSVRQLSITYATKFNLNPEDLFLFPKETLGLKGGENWLREIKCLSKSRNTNLKCWSPLLAFPSQEIQTCFIFFNNWLSWSFIYHWAFNGWHYFSHFTLCYSMNTICAFGNAVCAKLPFVFNVTLKLMVLLSVLI